MSYLVRSGNNRNDIYFLNSNNTAASYLHRTSWTGRNSMQWLTINSSNTSPDAVLLQRNGTGRNDLIWDNHNISFFSFKNYTLSTFTVIGSKYNLYIRDKRFRYYMLVSQYLDNGYDCYTTSSSSTDLAFVRVVLFVANSAGESLGIEMTNRYSKMQISYFVFNIGSISYDTSQITIDATTGADMQLGNQTQILFS